MFNTPYKLCYKGSICHGLHDKIADFKNKLIIN